MKKRLLESYSCLIRDLAWRLACWRGKIWGQANLSGRPGVAGFVWAALAAGIYFRLGRWKRKKV